MKILIYTTCLVILSCLSCKVEIVNLPDLLEHINDADNGYIKSRRLGDKTLKVKYLPPEFFALRENRRIDSSMIYNRAFLISIGYSEESGDVLYDGITDRTEFSNRIKELSFSLNEMVTLKCDGKIYTPVLTNMERTYGLQSYQNFIVIFSPQEEIKELRTGSDLELVINDFQFETGVSHFVFATQKIDQKI